MGKNNCECGIRDVKISIASFGGAQTTVPRVKLVSHYIQMGLLMSKSARELIRTIQNRHFITTLTFETENTAMFLN